MLYRLIFCTKWIKWIWGCLQSSSIFVLVNGSPTKEIFPKKNLRQGDPWVPFLFLMVAGGFSGLVREAKAKNLLSGSPS